MLAQNKDTRILVAIFCNGAKLEPWSLQMSNILSWASL